MAWEYRGNRTPYYTRSLTVEGRKVRQYLGSGPEAEQAGTEDAQRKAAREATRQQRQAEQARLKSAKTALDRYASELDRLTQASLLAAGYYQHNHGQWRRRGKPRNGHQHQAPNNRPDAGTD